MSIVAPIIVAAAITTVGSPSVTPLTPLGTAASAHATLLAAASAAVRRQAPVLDRRQGGEARAVRRQTRYQSTGNSIATRASAIFAGTILGALVGTMGGALIGSVGGENGALAGAQVGMPVGAMSGGILAAVWVR